MTIKHYYTSRELHGKANIIRIEQVDSYAIVELDQTWFAPKGGGQQSDQGRMDESLVVDVRYGANDSIQHLLPLEAIDLFTVGQIVTLDVDAQRRESNCILHTAGHLVAQVAEKVLPNSRAVQGHHWPGEARVELDVDHDFDIQSTQLQIEALLATIIKEDRRIHYTDGLSSRRTVRIEGFEPIECGGTHVASLASLGSVLLRNAKHKKGRLKIGYECKQSR
jgi:Ser-tRNA(Ala) deacylase AlaX